ncbi:TonB-dependent receptor [Aquincola sp. S2]|uniref:TonB-dependent receptor n=1 Tax=Pseudaquabacterium terrae TaxID=2732868 RepID=A0ABX2EIQ0_9BURK|nr:TonB-dependent receptor [Aquabacterium terrae]NRF68498.1 TonB-dependent receptor [Aquabacterium terrae]
MNGVRYAVVLAALLPTLTATAQDDVRPADPVVITGTAFRRLAQETGLPVTVIQAREWRRAGITSAEALVRSISADQGLVGISAAVGSFHAGRSEAGLRGLGGNRTLVLLDSRRLPNHPYTSAAPDLSAIPFAALERVEVLRDGASAIYGSDAIGGVINFVTRGDWRGVEASASWRRPLQGGGGDEQRVTLAAGWTDPQDRYGLLGVLDERRQQALPASERDFAASGVNLEHGAIKSSGITFPANVSQPGTNVSANPYFPACRPPDSFSLVPTFGQTCRDDFALSSNLIPRNRQVTLLGRASMKFSPEHAASLAYLRVNTETELSNAAFPLSGLSMTPASPFYPGAGITPAVAGLNPARDISLTWRTTAAGKRVQEPISVAQRLVLAFDGALGGWNYNAGLFASGHDTDEFYRNGFVRFTPILRAVRDGSPVFLNPFGDPTPEQAAVIEAAQIRGRVIEARGRMNGADARITGKLAETAHGPVLLAVGAEARRETYRQTFDTPLFNEAFGLPPTVDLSVAGSRRAWALFAEVDLPLAKALSAQAALRQDRYSDAGSTLNPKLALRYKPGDAWLLRASANRGFRAPTLYELNQPQRIAPGPGLFNDPVLCPGGTVAPGGVAARDCRQQFNLRTAGNPNLKPETARAFSLGFVVEPSAAWSASLDWWQIDLRDQVGALPATPLFADPVRYADRFVRCGQLSAAAANAIAACRGAGGTVDARALAYLEGSNDNLGRIQTRGLDVELKARISDTPLGRLSVGLLGTYVDRYRFQRERDGVFVDALGRVTDSTIVLRWQHTLSLRLDRGPWAATVVNRYKTHYEDQNLPSALLSPSYRNRVDEYSLWDLVLSRQAGQNWQISMGVRNVFDTDPPFSNQNFLALANYEPRLTDPLGRSIFLSVRYAQ